MGLEYYGEFGTKPQRVHCISTSQLILLSRKCPLWNDKSHKKVKRLKEQVSQSFLTCNDWEEYLREHPEERADD